MTEDAKEGLTGLNVLIEGPSGTGKTTSIASIVEMEPQVEVFYQGLEPGMEALLGYWTRKGKPIPPNLHWNYMSATVADLDSMIDAATKVNTYNLEMLAKQMDNNRPKYNMYIELMRNLNDFKDQRTGNNYGRVLDWGTGRVLVTDGLTGLSRAAMSMVVGGKPVRSQSDWGIAMDQVEKLLLYLTDSCRCHFVLIAHIERETDQVLGGSKITVGTLGQKLAPKIPPMFSDVILSARDGTTWTWDTAHGQADLKTRNLVYSSKLPQTFAPIFAAWRKNAEAANG